MKDREVMTADRPDAPPRKKQKTFPRIASEWVLRELMRIRLAVWLLIVMAVTMIVGSIFPQGYGAETYIASWGETRYALFSRLGLLDLFDTKYFLILGVLLLLNLLVCSIVRLSGRRGVSVSKTTAPDSARGVAMGGDSDSAVSRAVRALTERGYYVSRAQGGMLSARRGPWPEGVSLLYHLALAIAIIGFLVSALHSYEGDVTLYPNEPVVVKTASLETGWQKFRYELAAWSFVGWHAFESVLPDTSEWEGRQVTLTLNEFITHWELYQEKYYPRDWISDVSVQVIGHGPEVLWPSQLVEVNRPLRAGGLTLYQMAYEQEFDVVVWRDDSEVERVRANAYVPFMLGSIEGMFFPGTLRVGTLYQKYTPTEPVVPHVSLKWQPPEPPVDETVAEAVVEEPAPEEPPSADEAVVLTEAETDSMGMELAEAESIAAPPPPAPTERIELGKLSAEEPLEVEGYTLTLENPYEGSVLTYRHDPGVPLLYIAITAFMLGLAIRTYWPSYRVSLWIEEADGGALGRLVFRATGMLGEPKMVENELVGELGGDAEVPSPAPPTVAAPEAAPTAEAGPDDAPTRKKHPLRDALPPDPGEESPPSG
ncbi:MAG: cytochrome c biogenesis protein ResB [Candidatus Eisenbacteria bacterium]